MALTISIKMVIRMTQDLFFLLLCVGYYQPREPTTPLGIQRSQPYGLYHIFSCSGPHREPGRPRFLVCSFWIRATTYSGESSQKASIYVLDLKTGAPGYAPEVVRVGWQWVYRGDCHSGSRPRLQCECCLCGESFKAASTWKGRMYRLLVEPLRAAYFGQANGQPLYWQLQKTARPSLHRQG